MTEDVYSELLDREQAAPCICPRADAGGVQAQEQWASLTTSGLSLMLLLLAMAIGSLLAQQY